MSLGLFSFVIAFHLLDINKTKLAVLVIIFWNIWYFSKPGFLLLGGGLPSISPDFFICLIQFYFF